MPKAGTSVHISGAPSIFFLLLSPFPHACPQTDRPKVTAAFSNLRSNVLKKDSKTNYFKCMHRCVLKARPIGILALSFEQLKWLAACSKIWNVSKYKFSWSSLKNNFKKEDIQCYVFLLGTALFPLIGLAFSCWNRFHSPKKKVGDGEAKNGFGQPVK